MGYPEAFYGAAYFFLSFFLSFSSGTQLFSISNWTCRNKSELFTTQIKPNISSDPPFLHRGTCFPVETRRAADSSR